MHPQPEAYTGNVNTTGPQSCYDEGKRCAETLFTDYRRQYDVPVKIAHIFNTYGPRTHPDDGRVISNFIVQALRGEALAIHGDGSQTRSLCCVDDLVEGLIRLMATCDDVTGPVRLGSADETSIHDLAEQVVKLTGSASTIAFHPKQRDDPRQRQPDLATAERVLGWRPSVPPETGRRETIAYFREVLGDP